jgi:molybdopterin synthase catalytic subunit
MIRVVDHAIDVASVKAAVRAPAHGAVLVFEGVARDEHDGRAVQSLFYEAYIEMAEAELGRIVGETHARWPGTKVAVVHRTGPVAIGEPSVVVAVGAPHRDEAYAANRYVIDELKRRAPIWKRETYADGTAWVHNR